MPCQRCHSLMFPIDLLDEAGGLVHQRAEAWRCFACGDIIDPVISENRVRTHHGWTRAIRQTATAKETSHK